MPDSKVAKPERLYGCNYCSFRVPEGVIHRFKYQGEYECPYCGRPMKPVSELVNT